MANCWISDNRSRVGRSSEMRTRGLCCKKKTDRLKLAKTDVLCSQHTEISSFATKVLLGIRLRKRQRNIKCTSLSWPTFYPHASTVSCDNLVRNVESQAQSISPRPLAPVHSIETVKNVSLFFFAHPLSLISYPDYHLV